MFKPGDKVVCVDNKNVHDFIKLPFDMVFTVEMTFPTNDISLIESNIIPFDYRRFVTLKEYRKLKLEKLCSKLEIK